MPTPEPQKKWRREMLEQFVAANPGDAFALYGLVVPLTHLTSLYNVAVENQNVDDLEHLLFLVVGYLFWRPIVAIEPTRHPLNPWMRLVYLMAAVPVDTFCGLALTSASHELFPFYETFRRPWGPSLVTDLHIGGSIMWVAGDSLMLLAMIPVVVQLVRSEEAKTRELDAALDAERARAAGSAS